VDKVLQGIASQEATGSFNGVHLRMERDASDWAMIMGGKDEYWSLYRNALALADITAEVPLFVASGLIKGSKDINENNGVDGEDNENRDEMKRLADELVRDGVRVCSLIGRCSFRW
jgi:hypothetical protein